MMLDNGGRTEVQASEIDGIATLTIDRPYARNAIALKTMDELDRELTLLEASEARVLLIRGSGCRAFVSGGDVKDFASIRDHSGATAMAGRMRSLLDRIANLPMPTIAALNGSALGGGAEVALACDLRVAADDIAIGFNQSQLAIMPAWGGVERLIDLVGRPTALRLMLGGTRLPAQTAHDLGLLDMVVSRSHFETASAEFAAELATPVISVSRAIKRTVNAHLPTRHERTSVSAVEEFARLWVAPEHWAAVENIRPRK